MVFESTGTTWTWTLWHYIFVMVQRLMGLKKPLLMCKTYWGRTSSCAIHGNIHRTLGPMRVLTSRHFFYLWKSTYQKFFGRVLCGCFCTLHFHADFGKKNIYIYVYILIDKFQFCIQKIHVCWNLAMIPHNCIYVHQAQRKKVI